LEPRQGDDAALGATTDAAGDVGQRRGTTAAWEDELREHREVRVVAGDPGVEQRQPPRPEALETRDAQLAPEVEEIMLDVLEDADDLVPRSLRDDEPEQRVELVDLSQRDD